jgi:peptidyl-prolyl cis-trans isomerase A (cyclophilin A)
MTARLLVAISLLAMSCSESSPIDPSLFEPDAAIVPDETYSVEFTTTAGNFTVDVTRAWSPRGSDRFRELVDAGFYDGCRFFRVLTGFVAQFGINGDPTTNSMWNNKTFDDDPVVESNLRGTLSFAKAGVNTRTTQIFINFGDNSRLDDMGFSPIGIVRTGIENVDAINSDYGETPDQVELATQGNSYLDGLFPNLDTITSARIISN